MKKLNKLGVAVLSIFSVVALAACQPVTPTPPSGPSTPGTSEPGTSDPGSSNPITDYVVRFYYGLDHTQYIEKTSYNGAKVGLTNAQIASFAVPGYKIDGYSTDAWKKDGITSNLDVYVQYSEVDKYSVTFKNPDGTVISTVNVTEGFSVEEEDIPSSREVAISAGYYFAGWDNEALTENVRENVVITATQKQADLTIPKTQNSIAIDGDKDNDYALIGNVKHIVDGKVATDWETEAKGLDATLYACWNGDYIYYYVEVEDPIVLSYGKDYYELVEDTWKSDKVELWSNTNEIVQKASYDAFGYYASGTFTFAEYVRENNLFATKLIGDNNLAAYKESGAPVITTATGYCIEFAIPAYTPSEEDPANCEKLASKDHIYLMLQVNSADLINEQMIQETIATSKDKIDVSTVGQIWTGRIGSPSKDTNRENMWVIILG